LYTWSGSCPPLPGDRCQDQLHVLLHGPPFPALTVTLP
jgi:hypothetical protein